MFLAPLRTITLGVIGVPYSEDLAARRYEIGDRVQGPNGMRGVVEYVQTSGTGFGPLIQAYNVLWDDGSMTRAQSCPYELIGDASGNGFWWL